MPKVSIVIPCYNVEKYITECLDSALSQTFKDFEVIIVNDGSTDGTAEKIQPYLKKYPNIKYFYQENKGSSGARNTGIRKASGEYIAFLDSDDIFLPQRLEKMINRASDAGPGVAIVTTNSYFTKQGKFQEETFVNIKGIEIIDFKMFIKLGGIISHTLTKRKIYEEVGFFDEKLKSAVDTDMWLRILQKGYSMLYIDEPLSVYRFHRKDSITVTSLRNGIRYESLVKIHDKILGMPIGAEERKIALKRRKEAYNNLCFTKSKINLEKGDIKKARYYYLKVIKNNMPIPLNLKRLAIFISLYIFPSLIRKKYLELLDHHEKNLIQT